MGTADDRPMGGEAVEGPGKAGPGSGEQWCLDRTMRAVGALTARVAHDFNNVLTGIRGNAELALMDLPVGHAVRGDLEEIVQLVERATAMTTQLMAIGRQQQPNLEALDLNALIEGAAADIGLAAGAPVAVTRRLTEADVVILADPDEIGRLLTIMVDNAREAMPQGGELVIGTERAELEPDSGALAPWAAPGAYARLQLSDTGAGIPAELLARVFEPYFTVVPRGKTRGLGLTVAYWIARQHGGWIEVASEVGRGTTFTVWLPAAPGEEPPR